MKRLKRNHKNLRIIEASYIYCKRHNLNYNTFVDDVYLTEEFHCEENSEFDSICEDLQYYRYFDNYELVEITEDEYELCIDKFGYSIISL